MKRTLATLAAAVGALVWTGGMGVALQSDSAQPNSTHTHVVKVRSGELPYNWEEDSLPIELYLWGDCNAGPCELHRVAGLFDGRRGCWTAVNDTTVTMCPTRDNKIGYVAYS